MDRRRRPFEAKLIAADYLREFAELLQLVDLDAVERIVEHLRQVRDADGTVYVAGNGGQRRHRLALGERPRQGHEGLEPSVHAGHVPVATTCPG